jgi:hypothetical protein
MHDPANGLPRISMKRTSENAQKAKFAELRKAEVLLRRIRLPRTPVNKSMKKDRGCYRPRPSPSPGSKIGFASAAYPSLILKTCDCSLPPSLGSGVGL